MNLAQALKRKNKLVAEYNATLATAISSNSYLTGATVRYNSREMLEKAASLQAELVALKTAIHTASEPMRENIFRISELKSYITKLKAMSVQEGAVLNYRGSNGPDIYICNINVLERDNTVSTLQGVIEDLQDKIDKFNALTNIK